MADFRHRDFGIDIPPAPQGSGHGSDPAPATHRSPASPSLLPALALLLADLAAAIAAFPAAFLVATIYHTAIGRWPASFDAFLASRADAMLAMPALMVAVFAFGGLYARISWEVEEIKRIFLACGLLGLVQATFQILTGDHGMRLWFVLAWPMLACFAVAFRAVARSLSPVRRALTRSVILVGSGTSPDDFAFQLRETQASPVRILRAVATEDLVRLAPAALAGLVTEIAVRAGLPADRPPRVVLVPADAERPASRLLAERLWTLGIPHSVAAPSDLEARRGLRIRRITGLDMVLAENENLAPGLAERALKRGADIAGSGLLLLLLLPAMLVIAALLRLEGPVFFGQTRIGRDGQRFRCLKFRSMHPEAERVLADLLAADPAARAEWSAYQKLARDPRITRLGRFLRVTSLDELPQLLNVLAGDMSLVGPRPIVAPEVAGYDNDHAYFASPDFFWYRSVRPGITGLWQVSGRATTAYDERIRLDRWYVRNWSIWLDISILIRTLRAVLVSGTAS